MTQFLGVINDNVFKFVMAFLLIDALGHSQASKILSATGAIYVIPFLLFSSAAGILADRFSKQKMLVVMKIAEIIIMILAIFAFSLKSAWACFTLLFILSTHSAMFGPSKYGIIPELVPKDVVSRANGLITSFTYLAIIIGTFLASFLTEITNRHFTYIAGFCLLVAIGGFFSSLGVKQTLSQGSQKKVNIFFIREIFRTLVYTRFTPHLLPAIFGSAFFLLIGGFTQLNIIPFALQSLNLSEVAGGYLFLATALGIALGSYLGGKISRKRIELGSSCLAGLGIGLFFILLSLFPTHLYFVIFCLVMIGILGGMFIVPFDTFIQLKSENEKRGQTIAAANFLSFTGVLFASFALYFLNQVCGLTSASSFGVMGGMTLIVSFILTVRLSDLALPYFSKRIFFSLLRFKRPDLEMFKQANHLILVMENATWGKALMLAGGLPNVHFFIPMGSKQWRWYLRFFYSIHHVPNETQVEEIVSKSKDHQEKGIVPCLVLEGTLSSKHRPETNTFFDFFKRSPSRLVFVRFNEESPHKHPCIRFEK
jgi:acyl-[acyl-carrier-protein]-phospholipid O-acyltransferase/long-chain-fatty-acid--[acyl-carrier-protein] ligase